MNPLIQQACWHGEFAPDVKQHSGTVAFKGRLERFHEVGDPSKGEELGKHQDLVAGDGEGKGEGCVNLGDEAVTAERLRQRTT
jgi:hypothetical protein